MSLTTEEKQSLLAELKRAYYSGTKRIKFKDREMEFAGSSEIRRAISDLESEIAVGQGKKKSSRKVAIFSRV